MTMTMGGTDEDCGELYHTAQWSAASNCGMLAKVKISQITQVAVAVGFVDAYENTNDHIAMEVDAAALRNCSSTADFCGMIFDTDATTDVWYCGASNNGTEGTPVAAVGSLAPTANTYFYVMVQTDTVGNVTFYYGSKIDNLVAVGYLPSAIAYASTNLLAPYVGFIAHETTAEVCTISRIVTWQDN
jgi:glycine cleavage system aminomethyltransferase T